MIIAADTVLTAAHCMFDEYDKLRTPAEFRIVAGSLLLNGNPSTVFITTASSIRVHENYNSNTLENDIAIMKLTTSIPTNNVAVYPVNLRTVPVQVGTSCQVTGWGLLSYVRNNN